MKTITVQNKSNSIVNVFSKQASVVLSPEETLQLSVANGETLCLKFYARDGERKSIDYEPFNWKRKWSGDTHVSEFAYITTVNTKSISEGDTLTVKERTASIFGAWLWRKRMESLELTVESAEKGKMEKTLFFGSQALKKRYLTGVLSILLMYLLFIGFFLFFLFLGTDEINVIAWFMLLPITLVAIPACKALGMLGRGLLINVLDYTQDARGLCKLR